MTFDALALRHANLSDLSYNSAYDWLTWAEVYVEPCTPRDTARETMRMASRRGVGIMRGVYVNAWVVLLNSPHEHMQQQRYGLRFDERLIVLPY